MLLIALFGFLSFRAERHLALFAIAAVPAAVAAFSSRPHALAMVSFDPLWKRRYFVTLTAVFITATLFYVCLMPKSMRGDEAVAYAPAADVVLGLPGRHRVFCQDFAWCSRFLEHPRFEVWWDGRADAYPASIWEKGLQINANEPRGASQRYLDAYHVDIVIAKGGAAVNDALARAYWIRITDLHDYIVWQRPTSI